MNPRTQVLCAWSGVLSLLLLGLGLVVPGFLPPHLPTAGAAEIVAIYQNGTTSIRLGTVLILIGGGLYLPFIAVISAQMLRMEVGKVPAMSLTQLAAGTGVVLLFVVPALFWTVAAYRPERSPDVTQALNDFGWLFFVMPFSIPVAQAIAIGVAVINDKSAIYPRWIAYFNFWCALLFAPGGLVTFFKTGPFAWNGLIAMWLPAALFGLWVIVMATCISKAAGRLQRLTVDA